MPESGVRGAVGDDAMARVHGRGRAGLESDSNVEGSGVHRLRTKRKAAAARGGG